MKYHKLEPKHLQDLKDIAQKLRIDSIIATDSSKSGHPTSCASMAEIMSVLFFHTMKYSLAEPRDPSSDRFILSKGHEIAFHEASQVKGKPTALIAKTFKGKDFPNIEDKEEWHGKPLGSSSADVLKHLEGLIKNKSAAYPDRYIECFIAEQNLVGVAIGAACRNRTVPFVSTFAAFFTRTFDQIRMGAISQTNVNFVGSHCGVSIGEDGPSQMALEDIAMFRTIPGK
ncbi:transketolase-like protein 2 [Diaphorina citri]|uniref:Transketolase-like protein 2 n=1 Tax=Diaphorina citri TaxID=121845 RepID=A0A3Q0INT4_DIACI|nr:transketolase-like protein 2 [Diaphorina citri]